MTANVDHIYCMVLSGHVSLYRTTRSLIKESLSETYISHVRTEFMISCNITYFKWLLRMIESSLDVVH